MTAENEGTYHLRCGHNVFVEDDRGDLIGHPMMCPHCWDLRIAIAYTSPIFIFKEGELDF
jgi:hypothetical protein